MAPHHLLALGVLSMRVDCDGPLTQPAPDGISSTVLPSDTADTTTGPSGIAQTKAFLCRESGCYWSDYTKFTDWDYYRQSATSFEDCQQACLDSAQCTGIEWKNSGAYCAFWYRGSCDMMRDDNPGQHGWVNEGLTCNKVCDPSQDANCVKGVADGSGRFARFDTGAMISLLAGFLWMS
eukprot:TRINITY_DN11012_c0_g1_i3.p2 TRINITY_DN11012_c0_g1~~TRINITY_DN11012_c0_g1_i3.p2  ORF type:complete len:179 (+),score=24.41 TRINITY_DN11012_c0_g1_i3:106-642(+)